MMRMGDVSLRRVGTVLLVALVAAERVEPVEGGELLVLKVDGKEASGPLFSDCHFLDERGTLIPKEEFLRRYMKRYVTAELSEAEGLIYVCRVKTDA